jgi:TonB family protein
MNDRSYSLLGSYILFKQLEVNALSELWRAGRLEGGKVVEVVALRRFRGGDPRAMRSAAGEAKGLIGQIQGSAVVRGQKISSAEGHVLLEHEYSGGRSLRGILDRATGGENGPHPIPVDQAIAIAERLAASAEALQQVRVEESRLVHGAIVPQFVWVTEDGEVRLAGHLLAKGVLASLKDQEVRGEITPYIAPELRTSSVPTQAGDIYAIGAILFLTLTGEAPPVQKAETALEDARLMFDDEPIPADLMPILRRSLATDPAQRFGSITELHQAIQKLVAGGLYAPTTFNLAFYLHSLLKKEMEIEAGERKTEDAVDVAALVEQKRLEEKAAVEPRLAAEDSSAPRPAPISSPLSGGRSPDEKRSRAPMIAAAILLLAAIGGGAFWLMRGKPSVPAAQAASASPVEMASAAAIEAPIVTAVAEPTEAELLANPTETTSEAAAVQDDAERRKAFEDEVNRRLREEVTRLQSDYERQIAAERAKIAGDRQPPEAVPPPVRTKEQPPAAPPAQAKVADARLDADTLNQQRLEQIETERGSEPGTMEAAPVAGAPTQTAAQPSVVPPPAGPPPVRQGDLIELSTLDQAPALVKSVPPSYPPMARKQRLEATVIISALISENGDVLEARVLRGDPRGIGFDEAALAAAKASKFSPPMKDGKRVRTWLAYPYRFQLPR